MKHILPFIFALFSISVFGQNTLSTYPTILPSNGFDQILFEVTSNQNIILDSVANVFATATTGTVEIYVRVGGYPNPPGTVNAASGWNLIGTATLTNTTTTAPTAVPLSLGYPMNAGVTYGIAISGGATLGSRYHDHAAADPTIYTDGIVTLEVGNIKGWGGAFPTPGNNPRDFTGRIVYSLLSTSPNDAGVSKIISPNSDCEGTYDVEVEISNYGTAQINSLEVEWSLNGTVQPTFIYNQLLDTLNGAGPNKDTLTLGTVTLAGGASVLIEAHTELPNGVVDTVPLNDSRSKTVQGFNHPVLNLGPNATICPGTSLILDAGLGRDSIRWSNNSTAQTLTVSTPGLYYANVYELGCKTTDSITIGNYPAPPAVDLGPDTMICDGTSLLLDATAPGVGYTWNDGSTAPTKSVTAAGTYSVTLTDGNGCESSDQILVGVHPEPSVILTVSPGSSICFGVPYTFTAIPKTNGSIAYQWKVNGVNVGGQTTSNQFTDSIGYGDTVSVDLITDICALAPYAVPSNKIGMQINPPPRNINGPDTVIENTSETYAVPLSTNSNFLWAANGGSISNPGGNIVTVTWGAANPNGSIICTETDNKSCSYQNVKKVVIVSIVGIREGEQNIGVGAAYPNPADDMVTIPVISKGSWNINLDLYDVSGQLVKAVYSGMVTGNRQIQLDVSELTNGLYFYKLTTAEGYETVKKLTINH